MHASDETDSGTTVELKGEEGMHPEKGMCQNTTEYLPSTPQILFSNKAASSTSNAKRDSDETEDDEIHLNVSKEVVTNDEDPPPLSKVMIGLEKIQAMIPLWSSKIKLPCQIRLSKRLG